jgi:hypothetical protein
MSTFHHITNSSLIVVVVRCFFFKFVKIVKKQKYMETQRVDIFETSCKEQFVQLTNTNSARLVFVLKNKTKGRLATVSTASGPHTQPHYPAQRSASTTSSS